MEKIKILNMTDNIKEKIINYLVDDFLSSLNINYIEIINDSQNIVELKKKYKEEINELEFYIDKLSSPFDQNESKDKRNLGIGFISMNLE